MEFYSKELIITVTGDKEPDDIDKLCNGLELKLIQSQHQLTLTYGTTTMNLETKSQSQNSDEYLQWKDIKTSKELIEVMEEVALLPDLKVTEALKLATTVKHMVTNMNQHISKNTEFSIRKLRVMNLNKGQWKEASMKMTKLQETANELNKQV